MSARPCHTRRSCRLRHPQSKSFRSASRWPSAQHLDRERAGKGGEAKTVFSVPILFHFDWYRT